jgi:hypothetical protein
MPTLQKQAIRMTREALEGIFRTARHVPSDKIDDWSPMGEARSVLSQLIEIALSPSYLTPLAEGRAPKMDEAAVEARKKAESSIHTLDDAERVAQANFEDFYAAVACVPDDDLDKEQKIPWRDAPITRADALFTAYWNIVYHMGQINYIQMMLGDREMH